MCLGNKQDYIMYSGYYKSLHSEREFPMAWVKRYKKEAKHGEEAKLHCTLEVSFPVHLVLVSNTGLNHEQSYALTTSLKSGWMTVDIWKSKWMIPGKNAVFSCGHHFSFYLSILCVICHYLKGYWLGQAKKIQTLSNNLTCYRLSLLCKGHFSHLMFGDENLGSKCLCMYHCRGTVSHNTWTFGPFYYPFLKHIILCHLSHSSTCAHMMQCKQESTKLWCCYTTAL